MKLFLTSLVAVTTLALVSCQQNVTETPMPESESDYVTNAGEYHNMYLDDILNYLNTRSSITRADMSTATFAQELAGIQSSVLNGTNLSGMTRSQIVAHIQRNINVSVSPDVIALAQAMVDDPNLSIIQELEKTGTLSTAVRGYVEEVDKILKSTTMTDASRQTKLDLAFTNWYRTANNDDRQLISATHDVFKKSKEYWTKNATTWERTMGVTGYLKKFLWGVARADGWALMKAFYHAGWYYGTLFWKEMLIASGVASAISAVASILKELTMSRVNGEVIYTINGSEISETQLREMVLQEVINQNPDLGLTIEEFNQLD